MFQQEYTSIEPLNSQVVRLRKWVNEIGDGLCDAVEAGLKTHDQPELYILQILNEGLVNHQASCRQTVPVILTFLKVIEEEGLNMQDRHAKTCISNIAYKARNNPESQLSLPDVYFVHLKFSFNVL